MYRKLNSTMSAVEIVSTMYDGPIPVDILMEARAEDARYTQDPVVFDAGIKACAIAASSVQIAHCRSMVLAKIADVRRASSPKERDVFCCGIRHWLKKYRAEQCSVRAIAQGAA